MACEDARTPLLPTSGDAATRAGTWWRRAWRALTGGLCRKWSTVTPPGSEDDVAAFAQEALEYFETIRRNREHFYRLRRLEIENLPPARRLPLTSAQMAELNYLWSKTVAAAESRVAARLNKLGSSVH
ncbi:uncharacterized protein LOC128682208 [Plodia interpunctella]|uniref:uncharacterized protein LOC128682208 n=1 Tax=Plodia interpunctella TaxID=58824 RepID=UPI002367FC17|nr:uncharacterized protein LOC128682208 [Plodia interpunctella]